MAFAAGTFTRGGFRRGTVAPWCLTPVAPGGTQRERATEEKALRVSQGLSKGHLLRALRLPEEVQSQAWRFGRECREDASFSCP